MNQREELRAGRGGRKDALRGGHRSNRSQGWKSMGGGAQNQGMDTSGDSGAVGSDTEVRSARNVEGWGGSCWVHESAESQVSSRLLGPRSSSVQLATMA